MALYGQKCTYNDKRMRLINVVYFTPGGWYERSAKGWWAPGEPMLKELQEELYHQISSREQ